MVPAGNSPEDGSDPQSGRTPKCPFLEDPKERETSFNTPQLHISFYISLYIIYITVYISLLDKSVHIHPLQLISFSSHHHKGEKVDGNVLLERLRSWHLVLHPQCLWHVQY